MHYTTAMNETAILFTTNQLSEKDREELIQEIDRVLDKLGHPLNRAHAEDYDPQWACPVLYFP